MESSSEEKGDQYFLEGYLEDVRILSDDDFCLVKAKCYRSMLKNEKPHELNIMFQCNRTRAGSVLTTNCSCKSGKGKCQHLSALFTHLKAKIEDNDSSTSRLQQWHRPRSGKISAHRLFESEFVKPRINRNIKNKLRKKVNDYLYDPRAASQRNVTIEKIKQLGESISNDCPTTCASWLQYMNNREVDRVNLPWGNPILKGSTLAHQLRGIYPEGMLNTVYTIDGLELVFEFPKDIALSKPLLEQVNLLDQEKILLQTIKLTPEKSNGGIFKF
jgi:hypothetical protein